MRNVVGNPIESIFIEFSAPTAFNSILKINIYKIYLFAFKALQIEP